MPIFKLGSRYKSSQSIYITRKLTCDVDGLRGFIPRSQLEDGQDYQSLVGKTLKVAFLEVNPESRKLVLSEKKASLVSKLTSLELGQLIEGEVLAVKPYGHMVLLLKLLLQLIDLILNL